MAIKNEDWYRLTFDGTKRASIWTPVAVMVNEPLKLSDSPSLLSGTPVLSEKAVKELNDIIGESVEILSLRCRRGKYYAVNVIELIDALDRNLAEVTLYKSSGRVMSIEKYAFKLDVIKEKHIFKIVEKPKSYPIVSDVFKNRVEERGLVGFKFRFIWDSEDKS